MVLATLLLVVVAGVAIWFERSAQHRAEQARTAELAQLTNGAVVYSAVANDLEQLSTQISVVPWSTTPSATNQAVLRTMASLSPGTVLALADRDGNVVNVEPADASVPVQADDPAFVTALNGQVG
nr:hypothetical protein [Micromonospora sp. DSM 115978]